MNYWTVGSNEVGKHDQHMGQSVFTAVRETKSTLPQFAEALPAAYEHERETQELEYEPLSPWSQSVSKRLFDCGCVLLFLPILAPVLLVVALAVRCTSRGPVLFIQRRVGRFGTTFPIIKFRTMAHHHAEHAKNAVTTADNQRFTPVGPFLRRSKLDELPQLLNVLLGHMSLVGPRPKLPEHCSEMPRFACRPGITGAATVAFALEEKFLASVPKNMLDHYYHSVVLPAKLQLDIDYMAEATFASDFKLLWTSVLRRWDNSIWQSISYSDARASYKTSRPMKSQPQVAEMVYSSSVRPESTHYAG